MKCHAFSWFLILHYYSWHVCFSMIVFTSWSSVAAQRWCSEHPVLVREGVPLVPKTITTKRAESGPLVPCRIRTPLVHWHCFARHIASICHLHSHLRGCLLIRGNTSRKSIAQIVRPCILDRRWTCTILLINDQIWLSTLNGTAWIQKPLPVPLLHVYLYM